MRKIYVVGGALNYANWMQGSIVEKIEDADLVVFTGGEDVDPSMYGKSPHPTTSSNFSRDRYEQQYFNIAKSLGKAMIGICRGAQFLCVMSGGILIQHQRNPAFIHTMSTEFGEYEITSTHHQAQYPFLMLRENYKVLGWTKNLSPFHFGESNNDEMNPRLECEIVFYPRTRCLAIQGHPEMLFEMHANIQTIIFLRKLISQYLEV